jgi:hypothetical protein
MDDKPAVPNWFLEIKGPNGIPAVATRQARYDGAIGARAIHSLQNYGEEEPVYDGNAYTYSSTYQTGRLKLYAHHVTAPTAPGERPEYHMTQVKASDMTEDREAFVKGATAFRNARDLAQRHRDRFIQEANARVRQPDAPPVATTKAVEVRQYESPGSDDFVDCEELVGSQESTPLDTAEPAMSSATSSTSGSNIQSQTRSKRSRAPHSPTSNPRPQKK